MPIDHQPRRPAALAAQPDRSSFVYVSSADRAARAVAAAETMRVARITPTWRADAVVAFVVASAKRCADGACECVCHCHGGTFCDEAEPRFGHSRSVNAAHKPVDRTCYGHRHNRK